MSDRQAKGSSASFYQEKTPKTEVLPREQRSARRTRASSIFQKMKLETIHGSFCFCFSLQAGTVILASMGIVLMITASFVNITGETHPADRKYNSTHYTILYTYTIGMTFGFYLQLYGAVKPSLVSLGTSCLILCCFFMFWIGISVMSFIEKPSWLMYSVCIQKRCPETHWIYCTLWRKYRPDCYDKLDKLLLTDPETNGTDTENQSNTSTSGKPENRLTAEYYDTQSYQPFDTGPENEETFAGIEDSPKILLFGSKQFGCTVNRGLMMSISIMIAFGWAGFMVYNIITVTALINLIDVMIESGEMDNALQHMERPY